MALQESVRRLDPVLLDGMGLVMTAVEGVEGWDGFTIQVGNGARIHHLWRREGTELEDKLFREYQGERAGKLFKRNTLSQHRRESLVFARFAVSFRLLFAWLDSPRLVSLLAVLLQQ